MQKINNGELFLSKFTNWNTPYPHPVLYHTLNYLPCDIFDQSYPPSCTSSGCILQLCKVSSDYHSSHFEGVALTRHLDRQMDRRMNVPTLHIVSYFAGTDAFMSLHKSIITLFLTPKKTFQEFTNSFHAKYKPISSKCWLGWTVKVIPISPKNLYLWRAGVNNNNVLT